MCFFGFYLLCCLIVFSSGKDDFEYSEQARWYDDYKQCSFTKQSPIELNSEESSVTYDLTTLSFLHYENVFSAPATIQNNGRTANIALPTPTIYIPSLTNIYDAYKPRVSGGPLPQGYFIADSVHFHWGSKDSHGSEHVIDSQRFSMEMHIVHRNEKFKSVEEAREYENGLAVLSVIYNAMDDVNEFSGLQRVVDSLDSIVGYQNKAEIKGFSLSPLLGSLDRDEYYTYQGSLTTPPCSQAVTWIVFANPITITHQQMAAFHALTDLHGSRLENNYRFLQSRGTRSVTLHKSWLNVLRGLQPVPILAANKI